MTDCEWDDPHDGYARFCLTHECWITAPVTVTACPISDLLGKVQRVRELRQKWRHDVIATMGKALPGGVLSVPLNAVESQLGRALDGDGK